MKNVVTKQKWESDYVLMNTIFFFWTRNHAIFIVQSEEQSVQDTNLYTCTCIQNIKVLCLGQFEILNAWIRSVRVCTLHSTVHCKVISANSNICFDKPKWMENCNLRIFPLINGLHLQHTNIQNILNVCVIDVTVECWMSMFMPYQQYLVFTKQIVIQHNYREIVIDLPDYIPVWHLAIFTNTFYKRKYKQ